jgi:hypothetical protein
VTILLGRDWQLRRSALNHDWLQNRYMVFLLAVLGYVSEKFDDPEFEQEAMPKLREWESHRREVQELLGSCCEDLSPRQLFSMPPLACMTDLDRGWLSEVSHRSWLARSGAVKVAHEARNRMEIAERCYGAVMIGLSGRSPATRSRLAECAPELGEFHSACQELSRAMSQFPSRVEIA